MGGGSRFPGCRTLILAARDSVLYRQAHLKHNREWKLLGPIPLKNDDGRKPRRGFSSCGIPRVVCGHLVGADVFSHASSQTQSQLRLKMAGQRNSSRFDLQHVTRSEWRAGNVVAFQHVGWVVLGDGSVASYEVFLCWIELGALGSGSSAERGLRQSRSLRARTVTAPTRS